MSHPTAPRHPARRLARCVVTRACSALLSVAVCAAAAGAALQLWENAPAFGARVAQASAGSIGGRLGRAAGVGRGAASETFARGPGRAPRDGAVGTGRVDIRGLDAARFGRNAATSAVRRHLELAGAGTYIGELLAQRDSSLTRWPDRPAGRPLAVYIGDGARLADWRPQYVRQVAAAFAAWTHAGVPLEFRLVDDSSRADVRVSWIDRFAEPISGRTVWSRDDRWWMLDATVTIALHHRDGAPLDEDQVRAISLHEVGHLLGLDHSTDAADVMAPRVRVRDISPADGATARLLYSVPAGRVR